MLLAEIIVGRTLTEVAVVGKFGTHFASGLSFSRGLVDGIPDKVALIAVKPSVGKFAYSSAKHR